MATPNSDSLLGTVGDDKIDGLAGNDSIDGGTGGIDTLIGNIGDDLLWTRTGDYAYGGAGNDTISVAGDQPGLLDGGAGVDVLRFESNYDITGATLNGIEQVAIAGTATMTTAQLASFSLVNGYSPAYTAAGIALSLGGTATVNLSATLTSSFTLTGSGQADLITFNAAYAGTIFAYMGYGNDRAIAGTGNDSLRGEAGNDTLSGLDGNDSIDGGIGSDSLLGGLGDDTLYVYGADSVFGGDGNDLLSIGGNSAAVLNGDVGQDTVRFENSYDISGAAITQIEQLNLYGNDSMTAAQLNAVGLVSGYASNYTTATVSLTAGGTVGVTLSGTLTQSFTLYGSAQADLVTFAPGYAAQIIVNSGTGNDNIAASDGNDSLNGELGNDTLLGLLGNDTLVGNTGADSIDGGDGNDLLYIGTGTSALGGDGDDLFSLSNNYPAYMDGGIGQDTLRFEGGYDLTGATILGFEQLNIAGTVSMTTTQLGQFGVISGYNSGYTTATVQLTQGGTANVTLSSTLTAYFSMTGSAEADSVTFATGYTGLIYAYMGGGNDTVIASSGGDSIRGDDGNDSLAGGEGNDSIDGGAGNDTLNGQLGNDYLIARLGDSVLAGTGDDLIAVVETGVVSVDGGANYDTLRLNNVDISSTAITLVEQFNLSSNVLMTAVQLGAPTVVSGYDTGYTTAGATLTAGGTASVDLASSLTAYFALTGSGDADILTFNATYTGLIYAYMSGGNDNVATGSGGDSIRGDDGNDTLNGVAGNDSIEGGNGNDSLLGGVGNDSLVGGAGSNSMDGGAGNDILVAHQDDSALGGANDDLIAVTDSGAIVLNGGTGTDTLRFENSYDISDTAVSGFENLNIYGTASMTAVQLASFNVVSGYASNYTTAALRLTAGGTVAMVLSATLTGGFTMTGSAEADIISFNAAYTGPISVYAGYGNDSFTAANGNDYLRGEQGNDSLNGLNGNDTIEGGSGADIITGGLGIDVMYGGSGQDSFVFATITASAILTPDRIVDFEGAGKWKGDLINLSAIDADGGLGAQDSFIFNSVNQAGLSLITSGTDTVVRLNTDADAAFEMVIIINDGAVLHTAYTAADFVL